jgi:hypothetical protein
MAKPNHVHKLKRLRYKSGNEIFFCALPDCSFKTNTSLVLGKRSICWRCGNEFIMNEYSLRLAKPHCDDCHKPKREYAEVDITKLPSFPENRAIKQGEIPGELSLMERLNQTIKSAQTIEEDEI